MVRFVNSTHERDALADALAELRLLVPALSEALERDQGVSEGEPVSGSSALSLPVNADVLAAGMFVDRHLLGAVQLAAETVGEPTPTSVVAYALDHAQRLHERLLVLGNPGAAGLLYQQIASVLTSVKRALGFILPDRRLGDYCPLHDDVLVELVNPGGVARLTYDRMDRGVPVNPSVAWESYGGRAHCRHCGAQWVPSQGVLLKRMLDEAAERRGRVKAGGNAESSEESEAYTGS